MGRLRLLLVEDDEDDYVITRDILNAALNREYDLDWLAHCHEALAAAKQCQYDLMLFDFYLGEKTGLELANEINSALDNPPPIILLTGQESAQSDITAIKAGASDYIVKQELTPQLLNKSIRYALARHDAQHALQESELRIRTILETIAEGIITFDTQGIIESINPAALTMFDYGDEIIGQSIEAIIPKLLHNDQLLKDDIGNRLEIEGTTQRGHRFPLELAITKLPLHGKQMFTAITHDISQRKKDEKLIEHQAKYDALTDLPNRRLFMDRLDRALASAKRNENNGALLFIDLDRFKKINDTMGHTAGDALLIEVARRLKNNIRDADTASRLGGDEFVILLPELSLDQQQAITFAHIVANKLLESIAQPYALLEQKYQITPSIGIVLFPNQNDTADDILRHADSAMYLSKSAGRNCIHFYDQQLEQAANDRITIEDELRRAIEQDEFTLHYQPQVDAFGRIIGVEALLRWQHPDKGLIYPEEFIGIAEQSGLILPIGQQVLDIAIDHIQAWQKSEFFKRGAYVSLNVSPAEFRDNNFVKHILHRFAQSRIPLSAIMIEITETMVIEHIGDTIQKMHALKSQGVRFSLDDFGTGYSSLSYLKRLPLDQIKIDKSFIRELSIDPNDVAIVEAILAMARHLNLTVIAEGVESREEYQFLQSRGCHAYQGHYFSVPLTADDFECIMETRIGGFQPAQSTGRLANE